MGRASHLWFGFGFGKLPLGIQNFSIFALWVIKSHLIGLKSTLVKARPAPYLLRVKSMLGLGQCPSLISKWITLMKIHFDNL